MASVTFDSGIVTIQGDATADTFSLISTGDQTGFSVVVNNDLSLTQSFLNADVDKVVLNAAGGDDLIAINTLHVPTEIFGGPGNDTLRGGNADDFINGGDGNDTIYGFQGNDELLGASGDDIIFGASGDDIIRGGLGADELSGQGGNDTVDGQGGDDFISGGVGNDTLVGGGGADDLRGNSGDDSLVGSTDSDPDILRGGTGFDVFTLQGEIGNGSVDQVLDRFGMETFAGYSGLLEPSIELDGSTLSVVGSNGNDKYIVDDKHNDGTTLRIELWHNEIGSFATADIDEIVFHLNDGNDLLYTYENEVNTPIRAYGGLGNDIIEGGNGNDRLFGGSGDDDIHARGGDDILVGGDGNDLLHGNHHNDQLFGGIGADRLYGDSGDDILVAGEDDDWDRLWGYGGFDQYFLELVEDHGYGSLDSLDTIAAAPAEPVFGSSSSIGNNNTGSGSDGDGGDDDGSTASIGDLVFEDLDEDGIFDADEVGIEGIVLRLLQDDVELATTSTDANGNYLFDGLTAGNYQVELDVNSIDGREVTTAASVGITLTADQQSNDLDFGFAREPFFGEAGGDFLTTALVFQSDSVPEAEFEAFEFSLDASVMMTRIDEFMILDVDSSKYVFRETMIDGELATQFYNEFPVAESNASIVNSFDIALRATGEAAAAAATNFSISAPFVRQTATVTIYPVFRPVLPGPFQPPTPRPDLDLILNAFQAKASPTASFDPSWFTGLRPLTVKEIFVLEQLRLDSRGPGFLEFFDGQHGLRPIFAIETLSRELPFVLYPNSPAEVPAHSRDNVSRGSWIANDGHHDAFRHAFLGAQLTQTYGRSFAENFTMAHEEVGGNHATREAMDLYNNSIGIRIASQNPGLGRKAIVTLIRKAITDGEMVVIDGAGNLAWSDDVELFDHGTSNNSETKNLPGPAPLSSPIVVPPTFTPPPATVVPSTGSLIDSFLP